MKKLKLNLAHEAGEILTKEEMRGVLGGAGSGAGTCGFIVRVQNNYDDPSWGASDYTFCNVPKSTIDEYRKVGMILRWCCDSCYKTDYCGTGGS